MAGAWQQRLSLSEVGRLFDAAAPTYEATGTAYFDPMGARLVDLASVCPGQRVLDVGSGRGAAMRPAARAAGPGGTVIGVDLSAAMVALSAAELTGHDGPERARCAVLVADAAAPPLRAASVDVVLGGMLAQFLPDPGAALRAWAELLTPGGRLGLSWWAGEDERYAELGAVVARHLPGGAAPAPSPRAFSGDVAATDALLTAASWQQVTTAVEPQHVRFTDTAAWWRWSYSHAQRRRWEAVSDLARLRHDVDAHLATLAQPDGSLLYQPHAAFTTATAPQPWSIPDVIVERSTA